MLNGRFITSEDTTDNFVGIRFSDGVPQVIFPHGFAISDNEQEQRKDVFILLAVLKRFTERMEGDKSKNAQSLLARFPIASYQYVIQDFLEHGYYVEKEVKYIQSLKGKVNWKRTIQQEKPQLDGDSVVYLNFQVKTNQINDTNLITQIHRYCVYKSFYLFGWLYLSSAYLPTEPQFKMDKKLFINTLKNALSNTFNDTKRKLFQSMINILNEEDEETDIKNCSIGVNRFDSVWENLIDYVFGEENKDKYFPHATWHIIKSGRTSPSSALEPDTIMKYNGKIYVLDAKYYQYGVTGSTSDLPNTSSIQKQITYGKHIAEHFYGDSKEKVYNAFIMPFNSGGSEITKFVSVGTADWEQYNKLTFNYAYVLGILLDTKWLISKYSKHNALEIEKMAQLIETSLLSFRQNTDN